MMYLGVDLGQRQDYSALAVVEAPEVAKMRADLHWMPPVDAGTGRFRVHFVERLPLGTPFRMVAERAAEVARAFGAQVVADATGVGAPVVETLRGLDVPAGVVAVTITSGGSARGGARDWWVPRADLLGCVSVLLESGRLKMSRRVRGADSLVHELMGMKKDGGGSRHDDIALALALACWKGRRVDPPLLGRQPVVHRW